MKSVIKIRSAPRGLKLPEAKFTEKKSIEVFKIPDNVVIPIQQNIGAPCKFLVKRGDEVKTGQKIADTESYVSAPIHSPISGKVVKNIKVINPATSIFGDAVMIASDGKNSWVDLEKLSDTNDAGELPKIPGIIDSLSSKEILSKIREGGVVGLGGAAFPTHIKLSPPPGVNIDTVILNGCECEPYITSDHRVLLEYGKKVLLGLYIIKKVLSPEKIYIAIESNKEDAIEYIEKLTSEMGFEDIFKVVSLPSRYPMGAEKTLIKTILGRSVPIGGLPLDIGVVVNNVSTSLAIYEAVIEGKPLIERVITITGNFKNPNNLMVRMGTPIIDLINYCGGVRGEANELILGGPMMGISVVDINFPITKGINCILVKKSKPTFEQNCIRCSRCVSICPMGLMPLMFVEFVKNGMHDACKDYYIENCIECGSCAYICPANIPIVGYIKTGKISLTK
jgi:electron transport complex protein RnfC